MFPWAFTFTPKRASTSAKLAAPPEVTFTFWLKVPSPPMVESLPVAEKVPPALAVMPPPSEVRVSFTVMAPLPPLVRVMYPPALVGAPPAMVIGPLTVLRERLPSARLVPPLKVKPSLSRKDTWLPATMRTVLKLLLSLLRVISGSDIPKPPASAASVVCPATDRLP